MPEDNFTNKRDYAVSITRGILGAVPFAGGVLQELVTNVVPNQRIDRIAKFARELEQRFDQFEDGYLRRKAFKDGFPEMLEEGVVQASRTDSDTRRTYIANLISNSLSDDSLIAEDRRHLLQVLGQMNDIEVLILRFYLIKEFPWVNTEDDKAFLEKHGHIVDVSTVVLHDASVEERDNAAIHASYLHHLASLGLLHAHISLEGMGGELPEGKVYEYKHEISDLGKLLLRFLGFRHEKLKNNR